MIKRFQEWNLRKKKNVVGSVLHNGVLEVFVRRKVASNRLKQRDKVPESVRYGFKRVVTDVLEVGKVEACDFDERYRPLKGGAEIRPLSQLSVGTLGFHGWRKTLTTLRDDFFELVDVPSWMQGKLGSSLGKKWYGVTNRHVVCKEYKDRFSADKFFSQPYGDAMVAYKLVSVSGVGLDCALLEPVSKVVPEVVNIGKVHGVERVKVGGMVKKMGRTTGFSTGKCVRTGVVMTINYGGKTGNVTLRDLDMFTKMSDKGDSGSAIVSKK